jgi:uncharacterized protein YjbJ (UPF0337 family)
LIQVNDDCRGTPQIHTRREPDCTTEPTSFPFTGSALEEGIMDKDRIVGSAKEVKGKVKEAVGKAVGDAKLESEGKADRVEGKVQNVIGGLKDTLKGK